MAHLTGKPFISTLIWWCMLYVSGEDTTAVRKGEPMNGKNSGTTKSKPVDNQYQPSKAELEADMSIPATPDELLQAVINSKPSKRG